MSEAVSWTIRSGETASVFYESARLILLVIYLRVYVFCHAA